MSQVHNEVLPVESTAARASRLAMLVAERYVSESLRDVSWIMSLAFSTHLFSLGLTHSMGGAVAVGAASEYTLEMAELKKAHKSNVIPLGAVRSFCCCD